MRGLSALLLLLPCGCLVPGPVPGTASSADGAVTFEQPVTATAASVEFLARRVDTPFTIVLLPDTQYYSEAYPDTFAAQTRWIVDQRAARNIAGVLHLGDIVDDADLLGQWAVADASLEILDEDPTLPYGLAVGNHDQFPKANPDGTANFNTYFPSSRYEGLPWYGGHFGDDNDNHYILFEAGQTRFLAVFLEFYRGGNPEVLAWASDVLDQHPDRQAIVVTHFAMTSGVLAKKFSQQGQAIRDALAAKPNFFMLLGGHFCGAAHREDLLDKNRFYSLLADYQCWPNGGNGYLRLLEFDPATATMRSRTYSPTLDDSLVGDEHDFALDVPFLEPGELASIGTRPVEDGTARFTWTPEDPGTYEWTARYSMGPFTVELPVQTVVVQEP